MQFDEIPLIDVSDRLALLTVIVSLRDVAAFGFGDRDNGQRLTALGKIIDGHGLHSLITPFIRDRAVDESLKDVVGNLDEVFKRVDADSDAKNPGRLLWVCRNLAKFDEIMAVVEGQADVGILLAYPPCCVERNRDDLIRAKRAFATRIVRAVGKAAAAVERALREDLEVEIPASNDPNIPNTQERIAAKVAVKSALCRTCGFSRKVGGAVRYANRRFRPRPAFPSPPLESI